MGLLGSIRCQREHGFVADHLEAFTDLNPPINLVLGEAHDDHSALPPGAHVPCPNHYVAVQVPVELHAPFYLVSADGINGNGGRTSKTKDLLIPFIENYFVALVVSGLFCTQSRLTAASKTCQYFSTTEKGKTDDFGSMIFSVQPEERFFVVNAHATMNTPMGS